MQAGITVDIADAAWSKVPGLRALARRAARGALTHMAAAKPAAIAIRFAGDEEIAALNRRWRGRSKPTNVLSFPAAKPPAEPANQPRPLGDIVLAFGVVAREAQEQGKPIAAHTAHLIVHGVLHLLGFDHDTATKARRMETAEVAILAEMGYGNPYIIESK